MTARAKLIILAILILTLTGGLLLATSYTQDLSQRLGGIAPTLSPLDELVLDFLCAFRDQILTGVGHARVTVYCTVGI